MRKQKGFSLIELLIVVGIIGALTAIAVPAYQDYTKKADATAGIATMKSLLVNIDAFAQNGVFPEDTDWADLGGKADMLTLGGMELAQVITGEGDEAFVSGGTLTLTFNPTSSLDTKTIIYTKSNTGWACTHTTGLEDLKGCVAP
ncbi:pilin [Enterovibrio nigricans]|uniref:Type IV pilus assembly protein PilA n=1 Tax=Enterovibrio nigricans DSM 22720 TaxID=1121868 RepID=A0A1T4TXR0_9GAMM|nr:pilin [Enterovibrio nigricans]PKF51442.1 prepilin-type cleavage/methylation domain-containing protein [Enterovibrio nigricans]SKA45088.1 type IV pilus assembly protein PilA [Enterovibrio nigricans DSM 22720]